VLGRRREVRLRREPERVRPKKAARRADAAVELPPEAVPVFEHLRAWRARTAKEQEVPAYVVFHDATLRQVATDRPATPAELGRISGVGENKLAKYGESLLAALAELD
jgi:ATP-dependent DNA helicase RecQ